MAKRKFKNISSEGSLDHKNDYMSFIHKCRLKNYPPETNLQTHHIVAIHDGGTNDSKNLIKLNFQDHVEAHRIRYNEYKQKADLYYVKIAENKTEQAFKLERQLGAKATHALLKARGENRWNSDYQRNLARQSIDKDNGGRSRGGKKAGKKRWANYTLSPKDKYLFYYQETPNSNKQVVVCIFNCSDGTQVLDILNSIKPNHKFIRVSPILSGKRKSAYGWSCIKLNV